MFRFISEQNNISAFEVCCDHFSDAALSVTEHWKKILVTIVWNCSFMVVLVCRLVA